MASTNSSRGKCVSYIIKLISLAMLYKSSVNAQQNFLSFIQPFFGNGGPQPAASQPLPQGAQSPQMDSFGGIGQFVEMFKNVRNGMGQGDTREEKAQRLANTAQTILSAFSNSASPGESASGGGSADGIGQYLNLGSNFGLGSALNQRRKRRKKRQSPVALPNFFTLFEEVAQRAQEKRHQLQQHSPSHLQAAPPLSRQPRPVQSNSPIVRLTDNFGRNFFQMLDEIYEYANMPSGQQGVSHAPLTPPAVLPTSPATPSLQQLFPWLPTLPTLPPPPQPPTPPPSLTSFGQIGNEPPVLSDSPQPMDVARDLLDANKLMRAFLKTMSKDANRPLRPMPVLNDGTELGRNRPLMDQLFESDILLTSRQMKAIVLAEAERKNGRRRKRKVITGAAYRWPKGQPIPFTFREPDKNWRQLIQSGLKLWEAETCLRFHEGSGLGAKDRIEFIRGSGCYSSAELVVCRRYPLDTAVKMCNLPLVFHSFHAQFQKGIVSHEVGHALGFWHEQSRPDRDQYIRLEDRYIMGGTEGNFAKRSDLESDGMGLPYDLGSVMHYGPNAFTTDWDHITIVTKDGKYQHSIGQRRGPSFIDVKQINRLYCHHTCQGTPVVCHNGGYADPNDCLRCKCPPGLGGPSCANVETSEDLLCGGELMASGIWQHLTHKGRRRCVWRIRADGSHRIRFILDSVDFPCATTCQSFLEIKHNSDFQQIGFRACCEEKNIEVLSEQAELLVISDPREMSGRDGAFTLRYIADAGSGAPLPKPPPPAWIPGRENRPFRGVQNKGGVIEKFILNSIPRVRDPDKPLESVASILTDYFASSLLGVSRRR